MENQRLIYLYHRCISGKADDAERNELYRLMAAEENEEQVKNLFDNSWKEFKPQRKTFSSTQSKALLSRILQHRTAAPVKPLLSWKSLSAAAAILIVLISGLYYQLHTTKNISPKETIQTAADNKEYDVEPGRDQAVLILADGSKIILDGRENGTVSTQGNIQVVKLDNRLVYDKQAGNGRPVYNTIATPKAGQYQITLSDGTKVWLNSSSSLHFPTAFTGSERVVSLTGEAYFEAAKDPGRPFRVKIKEGLDVEVLGTHFNIMAYKDEAEIKTTLLEGSVKINSGQASSVISPGQQASVPADKNGIRVLSGVNTEEAVAWKNGLFQFDGADIQTIMRQLSRWYDVEVIYEDQPPHGHYRGTVSRNANISEVLKILELSGINFTIKEGRKIIVEN